MTKAQVEFLAVARRRRWTRPEKERLVAASFEPGSSASEVARSFGLHVSQLFRWRKQLASNLGQVAPPDTEAPTGSDEAARTEQPARPDRKRGAGVIEITLSGGQRIRVDGNVDIETLRRVLDVLDRR